MKVSGINFYEKILKNKTFLKGLEKISEHGMSFSAGTSLVLAAGIRPLAIFLTPDTEKENKQYAASNSIGSGLMKFAVVEAVAIPIENAVKNIDKNPNKFLTPKTIFNMAGNGQLTNSRSYKLLTQIIKLSTGIITAIPKSVLTIALIPIVMDKIFSRKKQNIVKYSSKNIEQNHAYLTIPSPSYKTYFTGRFSDSLSKGVSGIVNNEFLQNFAIKHQNSDKNIAKHITAATDVLLTSTSVVMTEKSKKIKENRKKALIYNNIISTAITIVGGYFADGLLKPFSDKFIDRFKNLNANDPKLSKYIEGLNIMRPAIIFAGIYYCILPIFSTYISEKIDKHLNKQ